MPPPLSFLLIISNNFVAEFPNFCPTQKCPKSLTVCLAYHMAMQLWLVQLLLLLLSAHFCIFSTHFCPILSSWRKRPDHQPFVQSWLLIWASPSPSVPVAHQVSEAYCMWSIFIFYCFSSVQCWDLIYYGLPTPIAPSQ